MPIFNANFSLSVVILGLTFSLYSQNIDKGNFLKSAVNNAAQSGKKVYIFGTTTWCDACTEMIDSVFNNPDVKNVLNHSFLTHTIDLESDDGLPIVVKYRAAPAPQHLVFDENGQLIHRAEGFMDSNQLLKFLTTAQDSLPALAPLPHPLDFEMDYPQWYRNFRRAPSQRIIPNTEEIESFLASRDSITDEVTWAVLYSLPTSFKYIQQIAQQKEILAQRFGRQEVLEKLSSYIYIDVKNAIKDRDENQLNIAFANASELMGADAAPYQFRYKLYFYQYHAQWGEYAHTALELSQHNDIATADWLNDLAKTILSNNSEPAVLKTALRWMNPIVQTEKYFEYFITTARLEYALQNHEKAELLIREALASANGEFEKAQAEELLSRIKSNTGVK